MMSKFTDDDDVSESTPFTVDEEKAEEFNHSQREHRCIQTSWMSSPLWFFSTMILITLMVVQALYHGYQPGSKKDSNSTGTYETGFNTEFEYIKPAIKLHQVRYENGLREDDNGTIHPFLPTRYTTSGATYEEVDQAWLELIDRRYSRLINSEIEWLKTDKFQTPLTPIDDNSDGKEHYFAGPDMLHSLHCVDSFRKWVDPYYEDETDDPGYWMHVNHCIDQLRQSILCHGDMTPVSIRPMFNKEGIIRAYLGETERVHTCRDGLKLRDQWIQQRAARYGWLGMSKEEATEIE